MSLPVITQLAAFDLDVHLTKSRGFAFENRARRRFITRGRLAAYVAAMLVQTAKLAQHAFLTKCKLRWLDCCFPPRAWVNKMIGSFSSL
jgi:hypothetical protein